MNDVKNHVDDLRRCDKELPKRKLTDVKLCASYGPLLVHTPLLHKKGVRHYRSQSAKPKLDLDGFFLAGSTDPSTNNAPFTVPYLKFLPNSVLAKVLVQLLSVIITTGGVIL